jgi:putative transcriptional regulator
MTASLTPRHHPCCNTLLRYAGGHLSPGMAFLMETHLSLCPQCRQELQDYEAEAGLGLESLPPEDLEKGCLENLLSKIDEYGPTIACIDVTIPVTRPDVAGPAMPETLVPYTGLHGEKIRWPHAIHFAEWPMPIRQARMVRIPHGHVAADMEHDVLLVVQGEIAHRNTRYTSGDIVLIHGIVKAVQPSILLAVRPEAGDRPGILECLLEWWNRNRKKS